MNASSRSGVIAKSPTASSGVQRDDEPGDRGRAERRRPCRAPRSTTSHGIIVASAAVATCAACGEGSGPAAERRGEDADEPGMIQVRRLRVERVGRVERLAVAEAHVLRRGQRTPSMTAVSDEQRDDGGIEAAVVLSSSVFAARGASIVATAVPRGHDAGRRMRRAPRRTRRGSRARSPRGRPRAPRPSSARVASPWSSSGNARRPRSTFGQGDVLRAQQRGARRSAASASTR